MRIVSDWRANFHVERQFDYTSGKLDELMDVIVESGAKIFVSAVGVPPKSVIDKLHKGGVLYAVSRLLGGEIYCLLTFHRILSAIPRYGAAKHALFGPLKLISFLQHAKKACDAGADVIVVQGGEAGGHTGHIPSAYAHGPTLISGYS